MATNQLLSNTPGVRETNRALQRADFIRATVALLEVGDQVEPTDQILELTALVASGATTLSTTAVQGKIAAGNRLLFVDTDGIEYLTRVATTVTGGATSIAINEVFETIPSGSACYFPAEVTERKSAGVSESLDTIDEKTFDNRGASVELVVGSTYTISLSGNYNPFGPVQQMLSEFSEAGRIFYTKIQYPDPKTGFNGKIFKGRSIYKGNQSSGDQGSTINADFEGTFQGKPTILEPAPKA